MHRRNPWTTGRLSFDFRLALPPGLRLFRRMLILLALMLSIFLPPRARGRSSAPAVNPRPRWSNCSRRKAAAVARRRRRG